MSNEHENPDAPEPMTLEEAMAQPVIDAKPKKVRPPKVPRNEVPTGPYGSLTAREREVALALVMGETNAEIAKKVGISVKTIDTHRGHILRKLGVKNNVMLVHHALRMKWVTL